MVYSKKRVEKQIYLVLLTVIMLVI